MMELETVQSEIGEYVGALSMTVESQEDSLAVRARVVEVRREKKRREKWFQDEILVHSKQAYQTAKSAYDAQKNVLANLLRPLIEWDAQALAAASRFEMERRRVAAIAQEKENQKNARARARAIEKGRPVDSVPPPMMPATVPNTAKSAAGAFSFVERKELAIFDESIIPDSYLIKTPNRKMIEAALRAGVGVPGCRLHEVLGSAVRTT